MIQIENVSFTYGDSDRGGISSISIDIKDGEFVVLCGESGCGKTTVTRLINGLIPNYYEGTLSGRVLIDGENISAQPLYSTAEKVASVFQNPRSQFFNVDTDSELSFGCENLGLPENEITRRVGETVREFKIESLMGRSIFNLSGGEKQKIACAGAAAMRPDIYVLDEPSSNLDAASVAELGSILASWKKAGRTVIISEHRLYYLRELADRFIYMQNGQIIADYTADEFRLLSEEKRASMGLRTLLPERLAPSSEYAAPEKHFTLKDFRFSYKSGRKILDIDEAAIPAGRIVAVTGRNGAGKSTFSRCFCGLEKRCGEVLSETGLLKSRDRLQKCYMVMQDVNHQLFTESVLDEVLISMSSEDISKAEEILKSLDLWEFKNRHPVSLSGGQKQRVAIASAIASESSVMFFDEPTSGLDLKHMKQTAMLLGNLRRKGISVFVITHDIELITECCTDVIHFENGRITDSSPVNRSTISMLKKFFAYNDLYITSNLLW